MTREEAIAFFEDMNECTYGNLEAVEMAISALSADGEYIKKEDLFNKTIKRNSIWNGTTNAEGKGLEEIVNDLPTYSFSDSAENKGEWIPVEGIEDVPKAGTYWATNFEGKTNGEVLISLYPNLKYTIQNGRVVTTIGVASSFDLEWWNAPYKAESEDKE